MRDLDNSQTSFVGRRLMSYAKHWRRKRISRGQPQKWQMCFIMPWFCWHLEVLKQKRSCKFLDTGFHNQALRRSEVEDHNNKHLLGGRASFFEPPD